MIGLLLLVVVAAVGWRMTRQPAVAPALDTQEMPPTEAMQKPSPTVAAMMQKESTATSEATDTNGAEVTIDMEAGSFYYKPNVITVKEGTKVKIVFTSVSMMHNFYIDEFNVKSPTVKSGNTETFEFVASKKGTYEYYCAVGSHRANGQVGTLIVE